MLSVTIRLDQISQGRTDLFIRKDCHRMRHVLVSPVHIVRGGVLDNMSRLHQVLSVLVVAFFVHSFHSVGHVNIRLHNVEFDTVEGYLVIPDVHIGRHTRIPTNEPRNHEAVPDEDLFADKGVECWVWFRAHGKRVDDFVD
jgi:hypothetical protein